MSFKTYSFKSSWILLITIIFVICLGQTFAKTGSNYFNKDLYKQGIIFSVLGYSMLIIRGVIWLFVLKKMKLSVAYPVLSLAYVIIPIIGYYVFHEIITFNKILACTLILAGVIIVAKE
jgi:undecaprenyl phosphate-alpha-L-ara4N flippase subunit ArnE